MTGQDAGVKPGGRFRPGLPNWKVVDEWEWDQFAHATSYATGGLLVAQMMVNNWDLKSSNNKVYEIADTTAGRRRVYVVRDVGASFGSNKQPRWLNWLGIRGGQGSKNDLADFEASAFIDGVDEEGYVDFAYRGPNEWAVSKITPAHVRWTANLMARISNRQWQDAFRAGGYTQEQSTRYIAKLKERIAQGLALR